MESVPVRLDLVDLIVASVGTMQLLIHVQTPLVCVRRAMLLQPVVSVPLVSSELQMEHVNVSISYSVDSNECT